MLVRAIGIKTDIMWPRLWFRNSAGGSAQGRIAGVYAPDVLLANWISPVHLAGPAATPSEPARLAINPPSEPGDFLSRVYANQEC